MTTDALVAAWATAWAHGDAAAAARLFAADGTFEDPTSDGPVPAVTLADQVPPLVRAFPGYTFERTTVVAGARGVVEWVLRGAHQGAWLDTGVPSGRAVTLRGVDVLAVGGDGRIAWARRYFDLSGLVTQLGLTTLVQPESDGRTQFGYSMRVASRNPRPPGVIALTWIEAADEGEKARIRSHSRQNVADFLQEPGFIAIVTGFTGLRGFTVTAWEDEPAMRRALGRHHAVAMEELFSERFVASVWTSVWQPTRINRLWVRCPDCGSLQDVTDDHPACTACRAALPPRPAFW